MNLNEMCLLGFILFQYVLSQDCIEGGNKTSVFVKTSDSIVLHFKVDSHYGFGHIKIERILTLNETREHICSFSFFERHYSSFRREHKLCSSSQYYNRTVFTKGRYCGFRTFQSSVEISNAEKADNGTYIISSDLPELLKYFTVFILGQPDTELKVFPATSEEGGTVKFRCNSTSTTIPSTHNLTLQTSWLVDNTSVENVGRFQTDGKDLIIHCVSRMDKNRTVSCKAVEERGLTTIADSNFSVTWGPDSVPELRPTKIFYNLDLGTLLPHIHCSLDCNPPCEMRWEKIGSHRVLSTNGTLSLGKLDRKSSGEYVCIATRNQTHKTGRTSVIVFVNEETPITAQNHLPVILVGGVLGAALLASSVSIVVLVRRFGCGAIFTCSEGRKRENIAAEVEFQSINAANYEELGQRNNASPAYDELNLGVGTTGCESVSMATGTTSGTEVYENTRKTEK